MGSGLRADHFGTLQRAVDSPMPCVRALGRAVPPAIAEAARLAAGVLGLRVVGIAWVLLFYPWFRDEPAEKPSVNAAELELIRAAGPPRELRKAACRECRADLARPVHQPQPVGACVGLRLRQLRLVVLRELDAQVLPEDVHHIDYARSEWMSALPMLCGGVASLFGGWLSDAIVSETGRKRFGRAIFPIVGHIDRGRRDLRPSLCRHAEPRPSRSCASRWPPTTSASGAKWAAIIDVGGPHAGIAAGFVNMIGNLLAATSSSRSSGGDDLHPFRLGRAVRCLRRNLPALRRDVDFHQPGSTVSQCGRFIWP